MSSATRKEGPVQTIEGKYEVLAKLREGGMGALYLVRHRLLEELRIIKVMRPELAHSAEQRKRFLREARTATRLKHPNIVGFFDYFLDEEGTAFMVMEYIEGINLRDLVRQCGPVPVGLAIQLSQQCLSALGYLHRKGIVHRDVSPDNVMMTQEDGALRAKLIDLGIAKIAEATEELTHADQFIGKLRYSSPEQLTRERSASPIDGRSDVYSFGVVLYEILTGVCPFTGDNFRDILAARLMSSSIPFEESDAEGKVPAELRAVIERSLRAEPSDRYQSAQEFGAALGALDLGAESHNLENVEEYRLRAIQAAIEAGIALHPSGTSLQRTLESKFRALDDSARQPGIEEPEVKATVPLGSNDDRPTVLAGTKPAPRQDDKPDVAAPRVPSAVPKPIDQVETTESKPGSRRYVLVTVLAVLLVAAGLAIYWLVRPPKRPMLEVTERIPPANTDSGRITTSPPQDSSSSSPANRPLEAPAAAVPPNPAPLDVVQSRPTPGTQATQPLQESGVSERESRGQTQAVPRKKPEKKPPRVIEGISPGSVAGVPAARGTRAKVRYCSDLEDTNFKQGITKEVPTGFRDGAARAPRPDAGLMRIRVSASPEHPSDGESAFLSVKFENGGDNPVTVEQLQESLSRGGYKTIGNLSLPTVVNPGGLKELYQLPVSLEGGEAWSKQFVVIDKRGDSWKATFSLRPCPE